MHAMKTISVVGALIVDADTFLVAQRAKGELAGYWEFPGGKLEEGETNFEAIEREIREELGVSVEAKTEISTFEHEYPFALIKLTLIMCHMNDTHERMTLDGSHLRVEWIDVTDKSLTFAPLDEKIHAYIIEHSERLFPTAVVE